MKELLLIIGSFFVFLGVSAQQALEIISHPQENQGLIAWTTPPPPQLLKVLST